MRHGKAIESRGAATSGAAKCMPGGIRTHDPRLRRPVLYPTELRALKLNDYKVGAAGFEPTTFCAQGRRATRLRYAPSSWWAFWTMAP